MASRGGSSGTTSQMSMSGSKKFVLRPVAKPTGMDKAEAYESLLLLAEAIGKINSGTSSNLSFEELYRHSYKLVLHKHGDLLYNGVSETIATHLNEERLSKVASQTDELLLPALRAVYERHVVNMRLIKDVLMYMDRSHAVNSRKLPIFEQGVVIFRSVVAQHPDVRPRVQRLLLEAIRRHRDGETMDVSLVRSVLSMLVELGISTTAVYTDDFEAPMLQQTAAFYHEESREVLASNPVYEYCRYAERRLNEERQRALLVMHPSTVPKLMSLLENKLVAEHAVALVEAPSSGLAWQLENDRYEDLNRLFRLFAASKQVVLWRPPAELVSAEKDRDKEKASPPVVVLKDVMKAQIMRKASNIVFGGGAGGAAGGAAAGDGGASSSASRDPIALIQGLLDLRRKYAAIVERAFHNDRLYNTGLKEAFENVVNRHQEGRSSSLGPNAVAEHLATYIDEQLKQGAGGKGSAKPIMGDGGGGGAGTGGSGSGSAGSGSGAVSDEWSAMDQRLNECIQLFRFLSSKDVFEEYYKQATAKRLLGGKVASDDVERMMIGKLKAECGANYTNKLEGMFADLNKSAQLMQQFKKERRDALNEAAVKAGGTSGACDIDVTVLTAPNWSSAVKPVPQAKLPAPIQAMADEFTNYYTAKHNGRKLQWNASKGTAEVRWRVGGRAYDLTVSTYQMVILTAFDDPSASGGSNTLSYKQLRDGGYGIPEDELRRNLLSLCNPKIKILNKASSSASAAAAPSAAASSSSSKDIEEDDVFAVNEAFSSKLLRIKVPLISMKSAQAAQQAAARAKGGAAAGAGSSGGAGGAGDAEEEASVMANIEEGRKALLESVIVRIMKTRKHMEHNALVAEVLRMVSARFTPELSSIKKRIEHLIDRDYLERSSDNHNLYSYLA